MMNGKLTRWMMKAGCLLSVLVVNAVTSNLKSQTSNPNSQISNLKSQTSNPNSQISNLKSQTSNLNTQIIGYLSHDSVLKAMPGYLQAEQHVDTLRQAYAAELKRVEDEFNQKYEAFLEGRKDYPRTILLKRQTELQQMLQQNVDFKTRSQQELQQARRDALAPLQQRLREAIATVARKHQLAVVINTDANACLYLDPDLTVNITQEVMQTLTNEK